MNDIVRFSGVFPFIAGSFLLNIENNIISQLGIGSIDTLPGNVTLSLIAAIIISYAVFQFKTVFIVICVGICILMNAPSTTPAEKTFLNQEFWAAIIIVIILLPNARKKL